jgi:hypothetical protein
MGPNSLAAALLTRMSTGLVGEAYHCIAILQAGGDEAR